jgi:hypothetical protein
MILMLKPIGREVCAMRQWPRFECVSRVHGPGVYGLEAPDRSNRRAGKKIYAMAHVLLSPHVGPHPCRIVRYLCGTTPGTEVARRARYFSVHARPSRGRFDGSCPVWDAHVKQASRFGYPACYPAWRGHHESLFAL